jgi:integrase
MYDISKLVGHTTIATTSMIYTHMFDETSKDGIEKISAVIDKAKE